MLIDAKGMDYRTLNEMVRGSDSSEIIHCCGQRFIGAGMKSQRITIDGIPGNALGAYLAGAEITVNDDAQDAVGDTMNDGKIVIHGNAGDTPGYAMRGGKIFIRGNAGYRVGIHMKEYREKKPIIVIGGKCGSFFGEYQAGGILIVLGLSDDDRPIVSNFPCTGMHGGKVYLRGKIDGIRFPKGIQIAEAGEADMQDILPYLQEYSLTFGRDIGELLNEKIWVLTPDSINPYQQMYVAN